MSILLTAFLATACHNPFIPVQIQDSLAWYGFMHLEDPCRPLGLSGVSACWYWRETVYFNWISTTEAEFEAYAGADYTWFWVGAEEDFPEPPSGVFHGYYFAQDRTDGDHIRIDDHFCDPFDTPVYHYHDLENFVAQWEGDENSGIYPGVSQEILYGDDPYCVSDNYFYVTTLFVPR